MFASKNKDKTSMSPENLKKRLAYYGLSLVEAADYLNIDKAHISRMRSGQRPITARMADYIRFKLPLPQERW